MYWQHATFAKVLARCRYLRVVMENRSQVGPGMAVLEALGRQYGSGAAVSRALGRHVGHGMAVSGTLGRQVGSGTAVSETLGSQVGSGTATFAFFWLFSCDFGQFCKACEPSEVPCLSAKTVVQPFVL